MLINDINNIMPNLELALIKSTSKDIVLATDKWLSDSVEQKRLLNSVELEFIGYLTHSLTCMQ